MVIGSTGRGHPTVEKASMPTSASIRPYGRLVSIGCNSMQVHMNTVYERLVEAHLTSNGDTDKGVENKLTKAAMSHCEQVF